MILPALDQGGYSYRIQVNIGQRLGCGQHLIDLVGQKDGPPFLVSVKWQQVSGTAEQKVPVEVICLLEALQSGVYSKAYLVLGGAGWTLRDFYTSGALKRYITGADKVEVLPLESFVGMANAGKL